MAMPVGQHQSVEVSSQNTGGLFGRSLHERMVLFAIGFATFLNLYVTQPLLPRFRQMFAASELMVSLTVSSTVLAVAITAPLLGMLADRLGRKGVIVAAMCCLSLPTLMVASVNSLWALIVWRFLQGICIPGIIAVTMAYISEESPSHSVGSIMASYVTGTVVGGFAGRLLAGLFEAYRDWRQAFLLFGLLTMATAFGVYRQLPPSRQFHRQLGKGSLFLSLNQHLHNRQLLTTYFIGFNVLFCLVALFTYCNFYLADSPFHLNPAQLGAIFSVYLIGAVITPLSGRMLDRIGYRKTLAIAVGAISAGTILTVIASVPVILLGLTLASAGVFVCQATASSYVGKAAGHARSSAAGLYVSLYYLGGVAGSILPGVFWRQLGWVGCVILVLCLQATILAVGLTFWKNDL